jgi:hypothetical protein
MTMVYNTVIDFLDIIDPVFFYLQQGFGDWRQGLALSIEPNLVGLFPDGGRVKSSKQGHR